MLKASRPKRLAFSFSYTHIDLFLEYSSHDLNYFALKRSCLIAGHLRCLPSKT